MDHIGEIVTRWSDWYMHKMEYGHLYSTPLQIPVPPEVIRILDTTQDFNAIEQCALARLKNKTLVMPGPAPVGPPRNSAQAAFNHGRATPSVGKAAAKGAWEGVKSSGAGGMIVRSLLNGIFRR